MKVTFVSPSPRTKYPFWNDYITFMEAAAASLGIDLTVLEAKDRFDIPDKAREALSGPDKPDYLVFIYLAQHTIPILKMAEKAGVKSFISNTDVIPKEREQVGWPRQRFQHWIGHMYPDDFLAGYQLACRLLEKGDAMGFRSGGTLHLIGIGGNLASSSAIYRRAGLDKALDEGRQAHLDRFVLAGWKREVAREKTTHLLKIYRRANIVWAVNDNTAFGVLDAMKECGLRPNCDGITGGIDWSPEGIAAVKKGEMDVTIGGHFMEGAWALVLLYDYHHGRDFEPTGTTIKSQMRLIEASNVDEYLPALDRANWEKIDFTRFTRTGNPKLEAYDFSPDAVVRELRRK